jgi:sugar phosphate isomerase/epimerase
MTLNRRKFIKATTSATSALLLSSLDGLAEKHQPVSTKTGKDFSLKILATSWGFSGSVDAFCTKVKKEGYDGIEMWWPGEKASQDELFTALKKHSLDVGFLCGASQSSYKEHLASFKRATEAAATNSTQKPLYINCHSGRDYFSFEENAALVAHTTQLSKQTGIKICHETHRSRMLFAAPVAKNIYKPFLI